MSLSSLITWAAYQYKEGEECGGGEGVERESPAGRPGFFVAVLTDYRLMTAINAALSNAFFICSISCYLKLIFCRARKTSFISDIDTSF